jgi:hypothetical protein
MQVQQQVVTLGTGQQSKPSGGFCFLYVKAKVIVKREDLVTLASLVLAQTHQAKGAPIKTCCCCRTTWCWWQYAKAYAVNVINYTWCSSIEALPATSFPML